MLNFIELNYFWWSKEKKKKTSPRAAGTGGAKNMSMSMSLSASISAADGGLIAEIDVEFSSRCPVLIISDKARLSLSVSTGKLVGKAGVPVSCITGIIKTSFSFDESSKSGGCSVLLAISISKSVVAKSSFSSIEFATSEAEFGTNSECSSSIWSGSSSTVCVVRSGGESRPAVLCTWATTRKTSSWTSISIFSSSCRNAAVARPTVPSFSTEKK